jgi:ABC-type transport system involved in cytochrome bd biosynthesis fused ATPase/permease subunit
MKNELSLSLNPIPNKNIDCESVKMKTELKIAVEVQNVVFAYKKNKTILNNFCIQIPQGM